MFSFDAFISRNIWLIDQRLTVSSSVLIQVCNGQCARHFEKAQLIKASLESVVKTELRSAGQCLVFGLSGNTLTGELNASRENNPFDFGIHNLEIGEES